MRIVVIVVVSRFSFSLYLTCISFFSYSISFFYDLPSVFTSQLNLRNETKYTDNIDAEKKKVKQTNCIKENWIFVLGSCLVSEKKQIFSLSFSFFFSYLLNSKFPIGFCCICVYVFVFMCVFVCKKKIKINAKKIHGKAGISVHCSVFNAIKISIILRSYFMKRILRTARKQRRCKQKKSIQEKQ